MALTCILGFLLFFSEVNSDPSQPEANTKHGTILGVYKKSYSGFLYKSFEGIPYAMPMTRENRFQPSVLYNQTWKGVLNATTKAAPCLHYNQFHKDDGEYVVMGEEDCLYLNIYTRKDRESPGTENKRKAVIINIHPGGFGQTSSNEISPEYLMDKEGIILVTFNYRLGLLGFLSTGDKVVPGNEGLKDQVTLMKWVKENIAAFGGDAKKVTIMGLSAGGASVHFHMLSEMSKDLFHRAISISGSAFDPWALIYDVPEKTKKLAALVGCPTYSKIMVECLRQRPANVIVQQMKHFQTWLYNPFTVFGPVIEKKSTNNFMTEHPVDRLTSFIPWWSVKVPWIVSATSHEGLYPAAEFVFNSSLLSDLDRNWQKVAKDLLFFNDSIPQNQHNNISQQIRSHYLQNSQISINSRADLIRMLSDRLFIAPNVNSAIAVARRSKHPVWFYMYSQNNSISLSYFLSGSKTVIGAAHGDDYSLILKLQGLNTKNTKEDIEMSEILMKMITVFAIEGRPPKELYWPNVPTVPSQFNYLDFRAPNDINVKYDPELGNRLVIADIFKDEKEAAVGTTLGRTDSQ